MSFKYDPAELLKKIAPERKIKKMLTKKLTLKKAALSFVDDIDFIDKKSVSRVALKTVKGYQSRVAEETATKSDLLDDPAQLIQRVQNEIIFQISGEIKDKYDGSQYVWLPSSADEPRPEHQLNYGLTFTIGDGEMPGEDYGCQCGMEILTDDTQLNL